MAPDLLKPIGGTRFSGAFGLISLLNSKVRAVQSPVAWFVLLAAGATEKHIEPDKSVKFISLKVQYSISQIGGSQPNPIWSKRNDQGPIQISWLKVLRYIRPLEIAGVL